MTLAKVARQLNFRSRKRCGRRPAQAFRLPPLILVTDARRLPNPLGPATTLPKGAAVILRHYELGDTARRAMATRLKAVCRARGLKLLIAGDIRLACAVGADGLHLPEALVTHGHGGGWAQRQHGWIITAAAHSAPALVRAARLGVDAVLLSPVFQTASHARAQPLGPLRFAALVHTSPLPVYALGGINERNAARLACSGAVGLAALDALAITE